MCAAAPTEGVSCQQSAEIGNGFCCEANKQHVPNGTTTQHAVRGTSVNLGTNLPSCGLLSTKKLQQIFEPPLLPNEGLLPPKSRPLFSTRATKTQALLLSEKRFCVVLESPASIALLFHHQSSCACFSDSKEQEFRHFCTQCRISRRESKRHYRHLGNSGALGLREKVRHFRLPATRLAGGVGRCGVGGTRVYPLHFEHRHPTISVLNSSAC